MDSESGEVINPASEAGGELLIKSPLVMSHYWNKPDKTAEAIIEVPGKGPWVVQNGRYCACG